MGRNKPFIHVKPIFAGDIQFLPRSECPSDAGVDDREAGKYLQRLRWLDVSLVGEIPER